MPDLADLSDLAKLYNYGKTRLLYVIFLQIPTVPLPSQISCSLKSISRFFLYFNLASIMKSHIMNGCSELLAATVFNSDDAI